uniref:Pre-mRNA splicing Prp18-interacting factor n=1 Tax=Tanacetum cinerariifolium TaxID=118510 RepID=A0A6L2NA11_TANCI|nr:hypothetical protein [Tanacetum cinerariifolium]
MASFDYRLNPLYTIKECSSCGALYTTNYCCSNRSLVDKIICDLNKAPDSPHLHTFSSNQCHCFHCKDVLGNGEFCQRCTCMRCGSGLSKGLCLICGNNQNSLNDSPSNSENSSQSPPHINHHCCYECGDPLDEPCKNQTIDELPQTLPSFHLTFYYGDESPFSCDSTPNTVDDSPNVFNPPPQPLKYSYEFCWNDAYYGYDCTPQRKKKEEEKQIAEEQAAKARYWKISICYDNDEDYTIAIKPKEPDNSFSMGDEHLDTIPATESDEFIKSSVENLVPNSSESKGEHESDVPACDDFTTFSNLLFDVDDDFSYSDDEIDKADCDLEEEIRFDERLLYDNSSPRPLEEFNYENSDAIIESFSPSPIPAEDSDPFMEEIDLFLASDGSIPSGIDNDYSDSEGDNLFLERLLHDDHIPLLDILDFSNVVRVFLPFFTYLVTSSILLSSGSKDTIFDPGISNYHFSSLEPGVSHRSGTFKKFNVYPNHLNESPMEILSSTCFPMDQ